MKWRAADPFPRARVQAQAQAAGGVQNSQENEESKPNKKGLVQLRFFRRPPNTEYS